MNRIQFLSTLAVLCSFAVQAQSSLQTKSVSIFKNGSSFFLKEGKIETRDGSHFMEGGAPPAAFGTLWFSSPTSRIKHVKTHIKSATRIQEQIDRFSSSSFQDMLGANLNRTVTLHLTGGEEIKGQVEKVNNNFFLLQSEGRWMNLKIGNVERIDFASAPSYPDSIAVIRDTNKIETPGILIDFDSKNANQQLEMMYLRADIGWVPTYHINLLDAERARVTLQAVVINNAEDLVGTDVNFVVGVPNFIHRNQVSPLAQSQVFNQFFRNIRNPSNATDFANKGAQILTYRSNNFKRSNEGSDNNEILSSLTGSSTEDLFFYTLPAVNLKKGATAIFNILEAELPIRHLYEVRLDEREIADGFSFEENFSNKVWHTLKLKNTTTTPLTSGAATVTKNFEGQARPVSQDKITFTPAGGDSFLKLTVAPDVSVIDRERVTAVLERYQKIGKEYYDLVTLEGEIRIHNYKKKAIDLNVRRKITGTLKTSTPRWLKAPKVPVHGQVNEITDVCWELKLKEGEKTVVKYEYTIFVKSGGTGT